MCAATALYLAVGSFPHFTRIFIPFLAALHDCVLMAELSAALLVNPD